MLVILEATLIIIFCLYSLPIDFVIPTVSFESSSIRNMPDYSQPKFANMPKVTPLTIGPIN